MWCLYSLFVILSRIFSSRNCCTILFCSQVAIDVWVGMCRCVGELIEMDNYIKGLLNLLDPKGSLFTLLLPTYHYIPTVVVVSIGGGSMRYQFNQQSKCEHIFLSIAFWRHGNKTKQTQKEWKETVIQNHPNLNLHNALSTLHQRKLSLSNEWWWFTIHQVKHR
jgi:hypothetical protein